MRNPCDIHPFIGLYFIHWHIYLCVKLVFNAWYLCVKCMNLWMNELCTIFIINSFHAKFVMYATHNAIICEALWHWPQELMINFKLMGKLFASVLPIQRCVLDPIYAQFTIGMSWLLIERKKGPLLAMILVGNHKTSLSVHIH